MELKTYILSRVRPLDFYQDILALPDIPSGNVVCPIHGDKNPSLQLRDDGSAYCFGCKRKWDNIIDFYMTLRKATLSQAIYNIYSNYIEPLVGRRYYIESAQNLTKKTRAYKWLLNRGIGERTIRKYLLGVDKDKKLLTVPIFNDWGYCVNIRMFDYSGKYDFKVRSLRKGMGKPRLYPMTSLFHKEVYIFEGEMDTLLATQLGLTSITSTGGANSWRRQFSTLFKDKIVYICMDNDKAGQQGAKTIAKELSGVAEKLYNVIIPTKFGKDFTDFIAKRPLEAFLNIVSKTRIVADSDIRDVKKLRDIENFAREETMVADIQSGKDTLHIIVKITPGSEIGFK